MHRVELKEPFFGWEDKLVSVPNAPCGVERCKGDCFSPIEGKFLMHRVELKESKANRESLQRPVPNAPCGVERTLRVRPCWGTSPRFLMHRVELKVVSLYTIQTILGCS